MVQHRRTVVVCVRARRHQSCYLTITRVDVCALGWRPLAHAQAHTTCGHMRVAPCSTCHRAVLCGVAWRACAACCAVLCAAAYCGVVWCGVVWCGVRQLHELLAAHPRGVGAAPQAGRRIHVRRHTFAKPHLILPAWPPNAAVHTPSTHHWSLERPSTTHPFPHTREHTPRRQTDRQTDRPTQTHTHARTCTCTCTCTRTRT